MNPTTNRSLIETFATAIATNDTDMLLAILDEDVTYLVPGRNHISGTYRGCEKIAAALMAPPAAGATIDAVAVTEIMADGDRGFVSVHLSGSSATEPFAFEVAFHLQTDTTSIIAITEYSGDQHAMDALLGEADHLLSP